MPRSRALLGLLIAPAVAVGIAVWAEFADLGPPLLLAVAVPAIVVSTLSAGYLLRARPIALVLVGGLVGLLTFTIAEGGYLALHYARGGTLNAQCCDTQSEMAAALFGIHVAVGSAVGLTVGAALGLVMVLWRALRLRGAAAARTL
jgi:hypothetical protein